MHLYFLICRLFIILHEYFYFFIIVSTSYNLHVFTKLILIILVSAIFINLDTVFLLGIKIVYFININMKVNITQLLLHVLSNLCYRLFFMRYCLLYQKKGQGRKTYRIHITHYHIFDPSFIIHLT